MRVLGLDTALGALSVAIIEDGRVRASAFEEMVRGQAERLAPMTARVLSDAGLDAAGIERVAVTIGPGTFTGQRVGLSFARGLAAATGAACVGVTTLHAMADEARTLFPDAAIHVAASDARRGEAYAQMFAANDGAMAELSGPVLLTHDALVARVAELLNEHRVIVSGSAGAIIRVSLDHATGLVISPVIQPHAIHVARLGALVDPAKSPPLPLYLRAADAKLPGPPKPLPTRRRS